MATKSNKSNTVKPLPSALTVANPSEFRSVKSVAETKAKASASQPVLATKSAGKRARAGSKSVPLNGGPNPVVEAPVQATAAPKANGTVEVAFLLLEPEAKKVFVCGSFNHWAPDEIELTKNAEGCWVASVPLPVGRYEYKFVVDGKWIPDLRARQHVSNEFGSLNSVIDVRQQG